MPVDERCGKFAIGERAFILISKMDRWIWYYLSGRWPDIERSCIVGSTQSVSWGFVDLMGIR